MDCGVSGDASQDSRRAQSASSPDTLMADVNSTLVKEVFDVAKGQRKTNVHHDRELDNLGRRFEVPEWIAGHLVKLAKTAERLNRPVPLTTPTCLLLN